MVANTSEREKNNCPVERNDGAHWSIEHLFDDLERRGDAAALLAVKNGALESCSSLALVRQSRALASGLLQSGLVPGEAVLLIGANSFLWVIARLALSAAGALAVPIDELATDKEVQSVIAQCGAHRILCDAVYAPKMKILAPDLTITAYGAKNPVDGVHCMEDLLDTPIRFLPNLPPDHADMLAYTSGTTGNPKAIVLTRANIAANVEPLVASRLVGESDRILLPLPLPHVYPFVVALLAGLSSGAAVVFPEAHTGSAILAAADLAGVSTIVGVPRLYTAICSGLTARVEASGHLRRKMFHVLLGLSRSARRNFGLNLGGIFFPAIRTRFGKRLRLLISGGAHLDADTLWTLLGLGFDVRSGYGLAETASMFTGNLPDAARMGSEGKPLAGALRIAAPDADGVGEIELKGPQVFSRYLGNPAATAAAFTPDGWFRTGDLGRVDKDGFLFVSQRARDVLVLGGGKKVNPEELERIYGASRYIREIAVLEHGGALVALVVPSLEASRGGALHVDTAIKIDLASRARDLPPFQRLSGMAIAREPLPRTRLGKYRRFLLPQIYARAQNPSSLVAHPMLSKEDEILLQRPTPAKVYEWLGRRYPHAALTLDSSPLLDLGIDSLEWISLELELGDRFAIHLSEADIADVVSVRDLLLAAERSATSPPRAVAARDWIAPTGLAFRALGVFIYVLNRILMQLLFRLRSEGVRNIPGDANFVMIPNHASYLDAPAIAAVMPLRTLRHTYWAADAAILFSKWWQLPLNRAMHCYPVDEHQPSQALAESQSLLARGDNIVWFPEGWRTPDGILQTFLPGIGHLLEKQPVQVVPIYIDGAFEAWPRHRRFPRLRPIRVRIGKPISPDTWNMAGNTQDLPIRIAERLQAAVATLAPTLKA